MWNGQRRAPRFHESRIAFSAGVGMGDCIKLTQM